MRRNTPKVRKEEETHEIEIMRYTVVSKGRETQEIENLS